MRSPRRHPWPRDASSDERVSGGSTSRTPLPFGSCNVVVVEERGQGTLLYAVFPAREALHRRLDTERHGRRLGKLPRGTRNLVRGTRNLVRGTRNLVRGTRNLVRGTRNLVRGTRNLVRGTRKLPRGGRKLVHGTRKP